MVIAREVHALEQQAVIMGHEFWNIIGETAYEELFDIYQEVVWRRVHMLDALAFGF
jgi:hypothetical protein